MAHPSVIPFLLMLATAAGCKSLGSRSNAELLENGQGGAGGQASAAVAIVTINGRDSCRLQSVDGGNWPKNLYTYQPARTLAKALEAKGVASDVLHICLFGADFRLSEENMRLIAAYRKDGRDGFVGNALLPSRRKFVHDLPKMIEDFSGGKPVILIGHSYGGWTAMYAAMKSQGNFQVQSLFTLDPISPNDCTALRFLASDERCRQFPSDMTPSEVKGRAGLWINFFQRQGKIASNQASGALNSYHNLNNEECSHRYAGADKGVWKILMDAATAAATGGNIAALQGALIPFSGEPQAGTGGSCGEFSDSGASWSEPGDTATSFWSGEGGSEGDDDGGGGTAAPQANPSATLEAGQYMSSGSDACPYAKVSYGSGGKLLLVYSGTDWCNAMSGSFSCSGGVCTGTLFERVGGQLRVFKSNYRITLSDSRTFTDDGSQYRLTGGGLIDGSATNGNSQPTPSSPQTLETGQYRTSSTEACPYAKASIVSGGKLQIAYGGSAFCDSVVGTFNCSGATCTGTLFQRSGSSWQTYAANYRIAIDNDKRGFTDDGNYYRLTEH